MLLIERLVLAAFGLIALYLLFNSQEAGNVISSIGSNTGALFGTLQGRNVSFQGQAGGVTIGSGGYGLFPMG